MLYAKYFDKVYGCWLGKCICGNIGAPFEGMKQELSVRFTESMVKEMLPNDDLDLQVLFLDVVEKYGPEFTSDQLADVFYRNCPYAPGEYAYFKKNYECGIHPPLSGSFNNEVYRNGMGCTIRSEIWACLAPGDPVRAVEFCKRDGVLDHRGDGLYGEMFMAALESLAFAESDVLSLIAQAKEFVPEESRLRALIDDTVRWAAEEASFRAVRERIVAHYGSAEATSVYQNIGFILLGLLRGSDDLLLSTIEVCNCGFDTDCTCATFGAIKGILAGARKLNEGYDFSGANYKLGVTAKPRSGLVYDLSEEVAELGAKLNGMEGAPKKYIPDAFEEAEKIRFRVEYEGDDPSVSFEKKGKATLYADNAAPEPVHLRFSCSGPLRLNVSEADVPANGSMALQIEAEVEKSADAMPRNNLVDVHFGEGKLFRFGFCGAARYEVYGPFWKNNVEVPALLEKQSYWDYFPAKDLSEQMDKIRFYHTNCLARDVPMEEAISEKYFLGTISPCGDTVTLEEHLFFDGQAYYWLRSRFLSPCARKCGLQAGHDSEFELYLNGQKLVGCTEPFRYTPENSHRFGIEIPEGENEIIVKIKKAGSCTHFSFDFLEEGACSNHITDFLIKK